MYAGDEIYDDDITSGFDPRAAADWRLDQLRETSTCPSCGSLEPVRLGPDMTGAYGCSDCLMYDRCPIHYRWTIAEHGGRCVECAAGVA